MSNLLSYLNSDKLIHGTLDPLISEISPAVLFYRPWEEDGAGKIYRRANRRIFGGARSALRYGIFPYASLTGNELSENEIQGLIFGGALMLLVDDVFDNRCPDEIFSFSGFTQKIISETLAGAFPTSDDRHYFEQNYPLPNFSSGDDEHKAYFSLDRLAYHLYCGIARNIVKDAAQRNSFFSCMGLVQQSQLDSLEQHSGVPIDKLKKITWDKGGYTLLLGAYIQDSCLPFDGIENLYGYSELPLERLVDLAASAKEPHLFFRRQFMYELGGFFQYLDDLHDIEEDKALGIQTLATEYKFSKMGQKEIKNRLFELYGLAFRDGLGMAKFYLFRHIISKVLK